MKLLNFKTIINIFIVTTLLISCENDKEDINTIDSTSTDLDAQIEADPNYIAMKNAINNSMNSIQKSLKSTNTSMVEFKNIYLDQNLEKSAEIFNQSNEFILSNIEIADLNYQALLKKYPTLEKEVNCSFKLDMNRIEAEKALSGIEHSRFISQFSSKEGDCGWRYYTCLAAVGAPALACAISTGGMAAYLCVLGYGAGAILCFDSYCHL